MDRKQQLQTEASTRRATLENLKRELAGATQRFKFTRHPSDGATVADIAGRIRLAEIALDGVIEELEGVDEVRPVAVTSPRAELLRQRAQIVQRREFRQRQHQEALDQERRRCGYRSEQHIAQHVRNTFGAGELLRRRADETDERELANISAQLAELDRRAGAPTEAA